MLNNSPFISPIIIECTLYKYNSKDAQIIDYIKTHSEYISYSGNSNSLVADIECISEMLSTVFVKEVEFFNGLNADQLGDNVTSVYFLDNIIRTYPSVRFLAINVSNKRAYSRFVKETNMINFEYSIKHTRIDLPYLVSKQELIDLKSFLTDVGVFAESKVSKTPYIIINSTNLFNAIEIKIAQYPELESKYETDPYRVLSECVDKKFEYDNTNLLLILSK